jgi:putative ABC transport system permease protein
VRVARVTPGLFRALREAPAFGRGFTEDDARGGPGSVAVLSDGFWRRAFAADPAVLGRTVVLDGRAHAVVGVMPAGFAFPLGGMEAWVPLAFDGAQQADRAQLSLVVLGRLADGLTLERAEAALDALAARLASEFPATNAGRTFRLVRLQDEQSGFTAPFAAAFQASAVFVLLIACVNVGAVLAARAVGRRRELAVKAALGAGRWRIARPLLAESVVLAALGGVLAVGVAGWGIAAIRRAVPLEITRWVGGWSAIQLDTRALLFALLAVVVTALVTSLSPVLLARRLPLDAGLREGGRGSAGGPRRLFAGLVVAEMAAALVLVIGAALMVRGFSRVMDVYRGLRPEGVLVSELRLPEARYADPARVAQFSTRVLEAASSVPGVRAAAVVTQVPGDLGPVPSGEIEMRGQAVEDRERPVVDVQAASPAYFEVLGLRMVRGRALSGSDVAGAAPVAVVSESLARRLWDTADPVGREIRLRRGEPGEAPWRRVVGVVSDVRQYFFDRAPRPTVYVPQDQLPRRRMVLLARAADPSVSTMAMAGELRRRVAVVDPELPLGELRTLQDVIDSAMAFLRLSAALLAVLGGVATLLAALGVYGVFAHEVARRSREIGVRLALGAARGEILRLVLRRVLRLSAVGLGVGLPVAWALGRLMSSRLFGIAQPDPLATGALALGLLALAMVAGYVPARRAAAVDPVIVLRAD